MSSEDCQISRILIFIFHVSLLLDGPLLPSPGSGLYFSQQMTQVTTTEKRANTLATDRQIGPAGEGAGAPLYLFTKTKPANKRTTMAMKENTTQTQPAVRTALLQLWHLS